MTPVPQVPVGDCADQAPAHDEDMTQDGARPPHVACVLRLAGVTPTLTCTHTLVLQPAGSVLQFTYAYSLTFLDD